MGRFLPQKRSYDHVKHNFVNAIGTIPWKAEIITIDVR